MGREYASETHPTITIQLLRDNGLLHSDDKELFVVSGDQRFLMKTSYGSSLLSIYWVGDRHSYLQKVDLYNQTVKYGRRRVFTCPVTGISTTELHFVNNHFASREAHKIIIGAKNGSPHARYQRQVLRKADRLLGRDGRGPARGQRRAALIAELREDAYARLGDPQLDQAIIAHDQQVQRGAKPKARASSAAGRFAMGAALSDARGIAGTPAFEDYASKPATAWLRESALPRISDVQRPIQWLDQCFALDIRAIAARFDLKRSILSGLSLGWPVEAAGLSRMVLFLDFRDPACCCLAVRSEYLDGRPSSLQMIELVQPYRHPRWSMRCPVSGKNSDLLYFRDGFFASERVQRLTRRSQRA